MKRIFVSVNEKKDIRTLSKEQLQTFCKEVLSLPRYRADQVWQWLWQKGSGSFDDMSNLPKALRATLETHFVIQQITLDFQQHSADGTIKSRFRLHDGHLIESVLIPVPDENRYTVCVSSQVGCSLSCKFCATGQMKRERNLTAGEIYDQVFLVNEQALEHFGRPLTNIVYMGMGEPLLAFKPVMQSIERITAEDGLHMSPRRITVSTAGIAKMIHRMAEDAVRFNLALSLHAADDAKRNEIMPINEQNNLEVLQGALRSFYQATRNKITLEYIAFQNFNDGIEDARNLAKFCSAFPVTVNIIEYNPISGVSFIKSDPERLNRFASKLASLDIPVTVRRSRGKDIDAACGQLANKEAQAS